MYQVVVNWQDGKAQTFETLACAGLEFSRVAELATSRTGGIRRAELWEMTKYGWMLTAEAGEETV